MDRKRTSFRRRLKGYTSVFLMIILLSVMLTCLVMVEASAELAARSIGENVCAIAGRSVLSEFQKDLYTRYGIFAIRNSQFYLQSRAAFYIDSSLAAEKGLIRLNADCIHVDTSAYKFDNEDLLKQIKNLSVGLNMYILDNFSNTLSSRDDTYSVSETEYIIFGRNSDQSNQRAMKEALYALRFTADVAEIYADKAQIAALTAEALLLFPELPPSASVFLLVSSKAASMAEKETKTVLSGGKVPIVNIQGINAFGSYRDYLTVFLLLTPEKGKIDRMKKTMERNLIYIDNTDFSFSDYVFGFDLRVDFSKNASAQMLGITKRKGSVLQSFDYK